LRTVHLLFAIFLAISILTVSPAVAEIPWLNEAPRDGVPRDAGAETNAAGAPSAKIPTTTACALPVAQPVPLPDASVPRRARVIDKKFIVVMAALGGAETPRFTTHQLVLDQEYAAGVPWVTGVPPNQHLVAKYGAIYAAELLVTCDLVIASAAATFCDAHSLRGLAPALGAVGAPELE